MVSGKACVQTTVNCVYFSRLVLAAKEKGLKINYRKIWDLQNVPECLDEGISQIAKLVFDAIYDDSRVNAHIETYCKK